MSRMEATCQYCGRCVPYSREDENKHAHCPECGRPVALNSELCEIYSNLKLFENKKRQLGTLEFGSLILVIVSFALYPPLGFITMFGAAFMFFNAGRNKDEKPTALLRKEKELERKILHHPNGFPVYRMEVIAEQSNTDQLFRPPYPAPASNGEQVAKPEFKSVADDIKFRALKYVKNDATTTQYIEDFAKEYEKNLEKNEAVSPQDQENAFFETMANAIGAPLAVGSGDKRRVIQPERAQAIPSPQPPPQPEVQPSPPDRTILTTNYAVSLPKMQLADIEDDTPGNQCPQTVGGCFYAIAVIIASAGLLTSVGAIANSYINQRKHASSPLVQSVPAPAKTNDGDRTLSKTFESLPPLPEIEPARQSRPSKYDSLLDDLVTVPPPQTSDVRTDIPDSSVFSHVDKVRIGETILSIPVFRGFKADTSSSRQMELAGIGNVFAHLAYYNQIGTGNNMVVTHVSVFSYERFDRQNVTTEDFNNLKATSRTGMKFYKDQYTDLLKRLGRTGNIEKVGAFAEGENYLAGFSLNTQKQGKYDLFQYAANVMLHIKEKYIELNVNITTERYDESFATSAQDEALTWLEAIMAAN